MSLPRTPMAAFLTKSRSPRDVQRMALTGLRQKIRWTGVVCRLRSSHEGRLLTLACLDPVSSMAILYRRPPRGSQRLKTGGGVGGGKAYPFRLPCGILFYSYPIYDGRLWQSDRRRAHGPDPRPGIRTFLCRLWPVVTCPELGQDSCSGRRTHLV